MKQNSGLLEIPAEPTWLQERLGNASVPRKERPHLVNPQLISTTAPSPSIKHHRLTGLSNRFIFSQFRKLEVPGHDAAFQFLVDNPPPSL